MGRQSALLLLGWLALMVRPGLSSYLTGSGFPWEGCKLSASVNRWTVTLASYSEDVVRGSRACFNFGYKPLSQCTPSGLRCCGENHLNKFKLYIDPVCNRADMFNITVNGNPTSAAFKEFMGGDLSKPTLKITNMFIPFEQINTTQLCFSLKGTANNGTCSTLASLANPFTREQGVLEIGMYDKKVDNYECCPMFIFPLSVA
ncbi:hypothetical protein GPECTOR_33g554 [Gonium pectorale]|uniref:Pherophorin domain-containing protein n=1 Tax=Gonium pectorale TaxID=33097 RepID=A0A150GCW5_GONPE|nr:hypothetical protein GPECTOR_33g554 [Gonium pectorale]|eukprot:KXZ47672.1 hypothetical protein GPECTOR_33g554 [Gonium pectorale]